MMMINAMNTQPYGEGSQYNRSSVTQGGTIAVYYLCWIKHVSPLLSVDRAGEIIHCNVTQSDPKTKLYLTKEENLLLFVCSEAVEFNQV